MTNLALVKTAQAVPQDSDLAQALLLALQGKMDNGLDQFIYSEPEYPADPVRGAYYFGQLIQKCRDYYIYQNEVNVIHYAAESLAQYLASSVHIIEHGPGPRQAVIHKTVPLLKCLRAVHGYNAVDQCKSYTYSAIQEIIKYFSIPAIDAVHDDYFNAALDYTGFNNPMILCFGGTLFNLNADVAQQFPQILAKYLWIWRKQIGAKGHLIITQDANQDMGMIARAYNNPWVSELLRTVLHRIGRDLGIPSWNPQAWDYVVQWDEKTYRLDLGFKAAHNHTLRWDGKIIKITKGQYLHIDSSYKLPEPVFLQASKEGGFLPIQTFRQPGNPIVLHLLRASAK